MCAGTQFSSTSGGSGLNKHLLSKNKNAAQRGRSTKKKIVTNMLNHEPSLDLVFQLQQRAIDVFLAGLPEKVSEPFEIDAFVYFHQMYLTKPYPVLVLILECPHESSYCALMRNLEKVNAAAAACGIRYIGFGKQDDIVEDGKVANIPIVFQSFFD